jgi:hypothetical protein
VNAILSGVWKIKNYWKIYMQNENTPIFENAEIVPQKKN